MQPSYAGRVAVLTGAGGGLGRVLARTIAEGGAHVACGDLDEGAAAETAALVTAAGGVATSAEVDVSSRSSVTGWAGRVRDELGPPALVLNVAGVLDRRGLSDLDHEGFLSSLSVNLGGPYLVIRTFAEDLIDGGWGRVVNIASIAGTTGYAFPGYAASKAGLVNLTRSLVLDFWGTGVTVNAVCPGAMDTPMMNQEARAQMARRTPTGSVASAADVAEVVRFLCTSAAGAVNGIAIVVDGGATAAFRYIDD